MKKMICAALCICLFSLLFAQNASAAPKMDDVAAKSAIIMDQTTGSILYEKNAHEKLPPASVTKIMTLLLGMEAIADGRLSENETLTCSEHAASMGGSQIWLEPGETISMDDLLKCIVVVSANDASVMLAEAVAGTEGAFVDQMNKRAAQLGMNDTVFKNAHGLDDPEHLTSAHDIALMSRELMKHELIKKYTSIWMDTVRDGRFQLSNTNKLVKTYNGVTGLKTGFTSPAKYCLSATAQRGDMGVVAVLMGCDTSDIRFKAAASMLDFAFANYTMADVAPDISLDPVHVVMGKEKTVTPVLGDSGTVLLEKTKANTLEQTVDMCADVAAPVEKGQKLGEVIVESDGEEIARIPIVAADAVERLGFWDVARILFSKLFMMS